MLQCESFENFRCAIGIMQMIFNPRIGNSLNIVCLNSAMFRKKFEREKKAKFSSFTFSKLKNKELTEELVVHKVSELIHE